MKKIIFISIIFQILIISVGLIYLNKKNTINYKNIENNIVKIVKKAELISEIENPRGIFGSEGKTREIISSGFFINKNTIITVAHGVNNEESIYIIEDFLGNIYNGKLIKKDDEIDIAYIKIDKDFESFQEFNYAKNINFGANVFSLGFNQKIKIGEIKEIKNDFIYSNIIFENGESGGIMFNKNYEIIGINQAIDLEKNMGITKIISE